VKAGISPGVQWDFSGAYGQFWPDALPDATKRLTIHEVARIQLQPMQNMEQVYVNQLSAMV